MHTIIIVAHEPLRKVLTFALRSPHDLLTNTSHNAIFATI